MRKIPLALTVVTLIFIITGCDDTSDLEGNFWAQNLKTGRFYRVDAELLYEGQHCTVWVEKGCGVGVGTAQQMAIVYDNQIYGKMINAFSSPVSCMGGTFDNTMDFADFLGDGDGKLLILLLDIKDNYIESVNETYVAGYFFPGDLVTGIGWQSNLCDMIYIDVNPGVPGSDESNVTLAHEMQHLMNFAASIAQRSVFNGNTLKSINQMDIWIDEGLSSAAEWVYSGVIDQDHFNWFNFASLPTNNMGKINVGNNFFVWNNPAYKSDPYAILDDYATVYLFFQWLRLQAGGQSIYKQIINSNNSDYNAVVNATSGYSAWDALISAWHTDNSSATTNGYNNDTVLRNVSQPLAPAGNLSLYPGGGVYSNSSPAVSGDIDKKTVGTQTLIYNKNSDNTASSGTVNLSVSINPNVNTNPGSRSIAPPPLKGPFPISAGDMLRQNGHGESRDTGTLIDGITVDE